MLICLEFNNSRAVAESEDIMLGETEKAFDVMRKFVEVTNEFLMREDVKPLYQKFLIEKASK